MPMPDRTDVRVAAVLDHLRFCAAKDLPLMMADLAAAVGVSPWYAGRLLRRVPGVQVYDACVVLPDGLAVRRARSGQRRSVVDGSHRLPDGQVVPSHHRNTVPRGGPSAGAARPPEHTKPACSAPSPNRRDEDRRPGAKPKAGVPRASSSPGESGPIAVPVPAGLSPRQAQVLTALSERAGQPMPTYPALGKALGLSADVVSSAVGQLRGKGLVRPGIGGRFVLPDGRALLPRDHTGGRPAREAAPQPFPRLVAEAPAAGRLPDLAPRQRLPRDVFPAPGGCLWPHGDPREPEGFGFCGAKQAPGRSYCRAHLARAYRPHETAEAAQ